MLPFNAHIAITNLIMFVSYIFVDIFSTVISYQVLSNTSIVAAFTKLNSITNGLSIVCLYLTGHSQAFQ